MSSNSHIVQQKVERRPGIGFSQLKDSTELCNGVLQYHLRKSAKIVKKKGAYMPKNYCEDCNLGSYCREKCLLKELRKETTRSVFEGISNGLSQAEIAHRTGKDRSTINYYVQKLREVDLIGDDGTVVQIDFV